MTPIDLEISSIERAEFPVPERDDRDLEIAPIERAEFPAPSFSDVDLEV